MTEERQEHTKLSATARARRDAMLPALQGAVVREANRRNARRRTVRATAGLSLAASAVAAVVLSSPGRAPIGGGEGENPSAVTHIEVVNPRVELASVTIDDEELLALLAEMGRPAGLVRVGGVTRLTAPVTDAELNAPGGTAPEASSGAAM